MIQTIEPAYLPAQTMSILLDWKVTLKCNYDCSYCSTDWGHNNKIPHPPVADCLKMLEQMYRYVDVISKYKKEKNLILKTIPHWFTRETYKEPKPNPECYLNAIVVYIYLYVLNY